VTAWSWPASRVLRVIDGDTLDALVRRDIGFGGWVQLPVRLRLARINAPKGSTPDGAAARDYLISLLPVPPATVDLTTLKPYLYGGVDGEVGEWVAEVTLPDGRVVSDAMVAAGHAVLWDGRGPRPSDG
jgi:endonuclease YncB( thermonuclease family)